MSVYNGERFLKQAIQSILSQTYGDFEFIIIDDGSTDRTPEILRTLAHQDERIKIITNQTNLGLTKSLNKAISQAQGKFIARMDADDIAVPKRFERQIEYIETHPEVGIVGCAYEFIDESGAVIGEKHPPLTNKKIKRILIRFNPFLHSSVIMRKSVLDQVSGYDKNYYKAQDYDLWLRAAKITELANLPEILMQKRFTKNMISFKTEREQIRFALKARQAALKRQQYPVWNLIFFLKPFLATILPLPIVRFIRVHIFKQKMYAHKAT